MKIKKRSVSRQVPVGLVDMGSLIEEERDRQRIQKIREQIEEVSREALTLIQVLPKLVGDPLTIPLGLVHLAGVVLGRILTARSAETAAEVGEEFSKSVLLYFRAGFLLGACSLRCHELSCGKACPGKGMRRSLERFLEEFARVMKFRPKSLLLVRDQ